MKAIGRAFDIKAGTWFTKEELFHWFFDITDVTAYFQREARRIYDDRFELYLKENENTLLRFPEEGQLFLRKIPDVIDESTYPNLVIFGNRDIIDSYIKLIQNQGSIWKQGWN